MVEGKTRKEHQSLISSALENRPTFLLKCLAPPETSESHPPTPRIYCCKERTLVLTFMLHVYIWCVHEIVMFLMTSPSDLLKNDGTFAGTGINDAMAVVSSSLCTEQHYTDIVLHENCIYANKSNLQYIFGCQFVLFSNFMWLHFILLSLQSVKDRWFLTVWLLKKWSVLFDLLFFYIKRL